MPRLGHAPGPTHPRWRGGRSIDKSGYVYVRGADPLAVSMRNAAGYVFEHRLTMARHLGRRLRADETVHHINGDRTDNRIDNLQLRITSHGQGAAYRCIDCGSHNIEPIPLAQAS